MTDQPISPILRAWWPVVAAVGLCLMAWGSLGTNVSTISSQVQDLKLQIAAMQSASATQAELRNRDEREILVAIAALRSDLAAAREELRRLSARYDRGELGR